jgi:putative transposase
MFLHVPCAPIGLPNRIDHRTTSSQNWRTFVRNHAQSIVACDFLVVSAQFRTLYVFLQMEVGTRRILHCNVTVHPTAAWTLQQLREGIPSDHSYRFLIRDRDSIFSAEVDQQLKTFGLRVLRTPARAPKANAYCERLVGSLRRECLDFMIPLGETSAQNPGRVGDALQPGAPTFEPRTRDS